MKKTTLLFLLLFVANSSFLFAQTCGTVDDETNEQDFSYLRTTNPNFNSPKCINVYFHIVRNNDGSSGFNSTNLPQVLKYINQEFNKHNIYFKQVGFDFMNNSYYNNLPNGVAAFDLMNDNINNNAINIYLVNNFYTAGQSASVIGRRLIVKNSLATQYSIIHEIGHCLGLFHTHKGVSSDPGCVELTNGSNCSTCGDKVCDTPADPYLLDSVNTNCQYTGPNTHKPDITNFMSYSRCRNHFTPGQEERMHLSVTGSSILQQVLSSECNIISGDYKICKNTSSTFSIIAPNSSTINWQYPTDKMNIVSGQGTTSCTFNATNIGTNLLIKATVVTSGISTIYEKYIDIINQNTISNPTPTIASSRQNIYSNVVPCCGTTYQINHAYCTNNFNDLEYSYSATIPNPLDVVVFNNTSGFFKITKNSTQSFTVSVKARNKSVNCNNPSAWSNTISRLYRNRRSIWGFKSNENMINNNIPLIEGYVANDKKIYIEKMDLEDWFDYIYRENEMEEDEVSKINTLLMSRIPYENINVKIYNFYGMLLLNNIFTEDKFNIDLSNYANGNYFIEYNYAGVREVKQIIIN